MPYPGSEYLMSMISPSSRDKGARTSFETRMLATTSQVSLNFNEKWNGVSRVLVVFALRMVVLIVTEVVMVAVMLAVEEKGGREDAKHTTARL